MPLFNDNYSFGKTKDLLALHEGYKRLPYRDTVGIETIGYGRNLQDKGLSQEESLYLLSNDIQEYFLALSKNLSFFSDLDDVRKCALVDMCFMGLNRLLKFKKMLAFMAEKDFESASTEAINSLWAKQTRKRAITISGMIRTGEWP